MSWIRWMFLFVLGEKKKSKFEPDKKGKGFFRKSYVLFRLKFFLQISISFSLFQFYLTVSIFASQKKHHVFLEPSLLYCQISLEMSSNGPRDRESRNESFCCFGGIRLLYVLKSYFFSFCWVNHIYIFLMLCE